MIGWNIYTLQEFLHLTGYLNPFAGHFLPLSGAQKFANRYYYRCILKSLLTNETFHSIIII